MKRTTPLGGQFYSLLFRSGQFGMRKVVQLVVVEVLTQEIVEIGRYL
jgi:hypothetical protein